MIRILIILSSLMALSAAAGAQGTIQLVSSYRCTVPAGASDADDPDSLVVQYATQGSDTLMTATLRFERGGKLLEKQVALSNGYLKQLGYGGEQQPYFFQYRYDESGRVIYHSDALAGRYQLIEYTDIHTIVKTFDRSTRRLIDQEVKPAGQPVASK